MQLAPHSCLAAPGMSESHYSAVVKKEHLISHEWKARFRSSIKSSQLYTLSRPATRHAGERFHGVCPPAPRFLPKRCWSCPGPKGSSPCPPPPRFAAAFLLPAQCQGESADADLQPPSWPHPANPLGNVHSAGKLLPKRAQKNSVVQKWRVSVAVRGLARCQGREGGSHGGGGAGHSPGSRRAQ